MITGVAIAGAAIIGYLLGSARGFAQAFKFMADLNAEDDAPPWVESQRENAPFQ